MAKVNFLKNLDLSFKSVGTFNKRITFLLPILSVLVLGFSLVLGIIPEARKINKLRDELQNQRKIQQVIADKNTTLKTVNTESYALDLTDLTEALPDRPDLVSLIKTATRLLQEENLRIDDLKLDLRSSPENKTTFQVSVFGDLKALERVLDKIPSSRRLLIPEKMEFNYAQDQNYQIQLTLSAPYQPPPKEIGSVESPLSDLTSDQQKLLKKVKSFKKFF